MLHITVADPKGGVLAAYAPFPLSCRARVEELFKGFKISPSLSKSAQWFKSYRRLKFSTQNFQASLFCPLVFLFLSGMMIGALIHACFPKCRKILIMGTIIQFVLTHCVVQLPSTNESPPRKVQVQYSAILRSLLERKNDSYLLKHCVV